jgi:hypothetical protein
LSLPDPEDVRAGTDFFSLLFLLVGVITGIGAYFQVYIIKIALVKIITNPLDGNAEQGRRKNDYASEGTIFCCYVETRSRLVR